MKDGKANKITALSDDGKELIEGHIDNQILDRVFDIIVQNQRPASYYICCFTGQSGAD